MGDAELIIHNAPFDIGMLEGELRRMGHKVDRISNPVVDTLKMSRRLNKEQKSHKLTSLCQLYQIEHDEEKAHEAMYDCVLLLKVYEKLKAAEAANKIS